MFLYSYRVHFRPGITFYIHTRVDFGHLDLVFSKKHAFLAIL